MTQGKISLVGVGPGDPELVTRKAERVLREADVLYHPGRDQQTGFAYQIIRGLLPAHVEVRAAAVELAGEVDRYESLAAELAAHARAGKRAVFITEGDPLVYSTASRILDELQTRWTEVSVEVIPGVTSLTAVAAAIGEGLVQSAETLVVIPACHHADRLEQLIESHDRVVLVKVGSVFPKIVDVLRRRGWLKDSVYIEKVGTDHQRIERDVAAVDPSTVSYFSIVLVDLYKSRNFADYPPDNAQ